MRRRRFGCSLGETPSYGTRHRPPGPDDGAPLDNLTANGVYPLDVYDHPDWYASGHLLDRSAFAVARYARGRPNAEVGVFRAVPCDVRSINPGDWVTTVQKYAIDHGRATGSFDERDMCVLEARVPARCIHTDGNSLFEWGYNCPSIPKARVAYRPRAKKGRR